MVDKGDGGGGWEHRGRGRSSDSERVSKSVMQVVANKEGIVILSTSPTMLCPIWNNEYGRV